MFPCSLKIKLIHGLLPGKSLHLKRCQAGWCLEFGIYSGLHKHFCRVHKECNVSVHVKDSAMVNQAVVGLSNNVDVAN